MDLLRIAAIVVAVELSIAAMATAAVLVLAWRNVRLALVAERVSPARQLVIRAMADPSLLSQAAAQLRTLPPDWRFQALHSIQVSVISLDPDRMRTLLADAGMTEPAKRWIRSLLPWRRLRGVRILSMADPTDAAVRQRVTDRSKTVACAALESTPMEPDEVAWRGSLRLLSDPSGPYWLVAQEALRRSVTADVLAGLLRGAYGTRAARLLDVSASMAEPLLLEAGGHLAVAPSSEVRIALAGLCGAVGGRLALQLLEGLVKDQDARVRIAAVKAVGRLGLRPWAPRLAHLLNDGDRGVRVAAAYVLLALEGPGEEQLALMAGRESEPGWTVALAALGRLGSMGAA